MYQYFIAYAHGQGFGCTEIGTEEPVQSFRDVQALAGAIRNHNSFDKTPVVISFQLLRED